MRHAFTLSLVVYFTLSAGAALADYTQDIFFGDHRLYHDALAALGHETLEELVDEPNLGRLASLVRQIRGQEVDLAAALKASRARVGRALAEVADGRREPHRAYLSSRFDGRVLRDTLLKAERRSNVGAVLGGFRRYDEDDQARIDELHELVGEGVAEAIFDEAASWAGYRNIRLLAGQVATALDTHRVPTRELMDAQGDRAFSDALARARRRLAAVVRAQGRAVPGFLAGAEDLDHGVASSGGAYVAELFGAPSSFLGTPTSAPVPVASGAGVFGLPDA